MRWIDVFCADVFGFNFNPVFQAAQGLIGSIFIGSLLGIEKPLIVFLGKLGIDGQPDHFLLIRTLAG